MGVFFYIIFKKNKKKKTPPPTRQKQIASRRIKSASCYEIGIGWCDPQACLAKAQLGQVTNSDPDEQDEVEVIPPEKRMEGAG